MLAIVFDVPNIDLCYVLTCCYIFCYKKFVSNVDGGKTTLFNVFSYRSLFIKELPSFCLKSGNIFCAKQNTCTKYMKS